MKVTSISLTKKITLEINKSFVSNDLSMRADVDAEDSLDECYASLNGQIKQNMIKPPVYVLR